MRTKNKYEIEGIVMDESLIPLMTATEILTSSGQITYEENYRKPESWTDVDLAIRIDSENYSPYHRGDIVFVHRQDSISDDETGVFIADGALLFLLKTKEGYQDKGNRTGFLADKYKSALAVSDRSKCIGKIVIVYFTPK